MHRPALPGVDAVDIVSDRSFPRHAHDQLGIGVIRTGAHRSWSGIGPVEAAAGDVITVNPGEMHDGHPVGGQPRAWRMLYLAPRQVARLLPEGVPPGAELARPAIHDPGLARRFAGLFARATAPDPDTFGVEEALVLTLAHLFARHASRAPTPGGPPPFVARAKARLDDAPGSHPTLAELAALSGVSRFQLVRGFARSVGVTPHAYLLQQRVRLARRLLVAGQAPAAVAAACGFADQSHLTRAFARQFGITPGRFRAALA